jgi:putative transposase
MRQVLNAIFYVEDNGIKWDALPHDFPPKGTVFHYFNEWRKAGYWQRIHDTLRARLRQPMGRHKHPTAGCLDSQSVKSTQVPGVRGYDAGKNVKGRKRHLLVDTLGLLLRVKVTGAEVSDQAGALLSLAHWNGACKKLRRIWVDGTYRGALLTDLALSLGIIWTTVLRPATAKGFVLLARRWVVERTFAWLTCSRRLSRDYERFPETSEAWIYISMTRLMLRRLAAA